ALGDPIPIMSTCSVDLREGEALPEDDTGLEDQWPAEFGASPIGAPRPAPAEATPEADGSAASTAGRSRALIVARKLVNFVPAIFLFVLAIQFMKTGAKALAPNLEGTFPVENPVSTLGLGWLGAYLVLSGSPVAAVALSLFAAGALNELQAFTMLSGSRLGASFIVLLV